jgi:hypothetical protein
MMFEIRQLGGAMTQVAPHSTAFCQRYAPFIMQTIDVLMAPGQAEMVQRNTQAIREAMRAHSTGGVLPSWLGDGDHGVERMRAGFSAEHYARLQALKDRYDGANITFRRLESKWDVLLLGTMVPPMTTCTSGCGSTIPTACSRHGIPPCSARNEPLLHVPQQQGR